MEMLKACPVGKNVLVDPRDGYHKCLGLRNEDDEFGFEFAPEYDALSSYQGESIYTCRQKATIEALNETQRTILTDDGFDCVNLRFNLNYSLNMLDVNSHNRRLDEVRLALEEAGFAIEKEAFKRYVLEIGQDFKTDLLYTEEALSALQYAIEINLIDVFKNANLLAIREGSQFIENKHLQFIRNSMID
jgi:histone H3/H4